MKLPSISHLAHLSLLTFKRFPFVLMDAVAGTAIAIALTETEHATAEFNLPNRLLLRAKLEGAGDDSVSLNLSGLSRGLIDRYGQASSLDIPPDSMITVQSGLIFVFKLNLSQLQIHTSGDSLDIQSLEGDVLIGERR